jgi:hypothetical protein
MSQDKFTRDQFTVELAREWFAYDAEAGVVIRIKNPKKGPQTAGTRAGAPHKASGMRQVIFRGVSVYEQQLVWALCKGAWPTSKLRFKDGDPLNCRIENLCGATNTADDYKALQSKTVRESLPLSGVIPTSSGKFKAQIFRERMIYLGTFDTPESASAAYLTAKSVLHDPLNRGKSTVELLEGLPKLG